MKEYLIYCPEFQDSIDLEPMYLISEIKDTNSLMNSIVWAQMKEGDGQILRGKVKLSVHYREYINGSTSQAILEFCPETNEKDSDGYVSAKTYTDIDIKGVSDECLIEDLPLYEKDKKYKAYTESSNYEKYIYCINVEVLEFGGGDFIHGEQLKTKQ